LQVWREERQVCAYGYSAGGEDWMHVPDLATFRLGHEVVAFPATDVDPEGARCLRARFERDWNTFGSVVEAVQTIAR
jgi:hypothetical protein